MAARLFGGCRTMMAAAAKSGAEATAAAGKKAKGGIGKPVPVSAQLSKFLGANEASRSDAVKKIWQYIRQHDLQVFSLLLPCLPVAAVQVLFGFSSNVLTAL